jgi:excisionase family DNA binding protein
VNRAVIHPSARLLDIKTASAQFGITTGTLRALIKNGDMPVVAIPGVRRILIDRRDLEQRITAWKEHTA